MILLIRGKNENRQLPWAQAGTERVPATFVLEPEKVEAFLWGRVGRESS